MGCLGKRWHEWVAYSESQWETPKEQSPSPLPLEEKVNKKKTGKQKVLFSVTTEESVSSDRDFSLCVQRCKSSVGFSQPKGFAPRKQRQPPTLRARSERNIETNSSQKCPITWSSAYIPTRKQTASLDASPLRMISSIWPERFSAWMISLFPINHNITHHNET